MKIIKLVQWYSRLSQYNTEIILMIFHSKQRNNSHIDETGKYDPDIYLFIYLLEHMVIQSSR